MAQKDYSKARAWCFTINNPLEVRPSYDEMKMNYLIYQLEEGENGTPHLQGYVQFKVQQRMPAVKKIFNGHLTVSNGTPEQNKTYCSKEPRLEPTQEFGELTTQGKRNDLTAVVTTIRNAKRPIEEVIETHPEQFIKYHTGITKVINYHLEKKTRLEFRQLEVIVLYGPTGTGKTRKAKEYSDDYYIIRNEGDHIWFDNYTGQSTLIIDEFKNWITLTQLLGLLDGHQCRLSIKGAFTYAQWTRVIVTSNLHPDQWYPNIDEEHRAALNRRFTNILLLDNPLSFTNKPINDNQSNFL